MKKSCRTLSTLFAGIAFAPTIYHQRFRQLRVVEAGKHFGAFEGVTPIKKWARTLSFSLLLISSGVVTLAQSTYTAATCNESDVNAVINGPTHKAVSGDVIIVPAGSCNWSTGVTITGVGIDVTGQGTSNTGGGTVGAGTPTTTLNLTGTGAFFIFTGLAYGQTAKVELMTMNGSGAANYATTATISFSGTCTTSGCAQIRVDNINWVTNTWDGPLADGGFVVTDNVFGVIDHTTSSWLNAAGLGGAGSPLVDTSQSAWQGVGGYGDNSFASADTFGTDKNLFIEDNYLNQDRAMDNDVGPAGGGIGGDRAVCRFNTTINLNGSGLCSGHGTTWNMARGQRSLEAYYNTINCSANTYCNVGLGLAGGSGMFFSNKFVSTSSSYGFNAAVALSILRFSGDPLGIWGYCDGTHPYDQSPFTSTSECLDQPGTGAGLLMNTGASPSPVLVSTGNPGWPNPALDPVYEAGDYPSVGGLNAGVQINTTHIVANSESYAEVSTAAQTSPTSPFNGTTGTGYGTLANRPTTCTTGVGYWAIDQGTWNTYNSNEGELYICTAANTWTMSYEPYTYPHPLTTCGTKTAPCPPGNVKAAP